ncbi:hypothetical protein F4778DRAFT_779397 [Xylariomycetidae sp. FL2044]|nr:hypothetical protein F4778DRAFT_779397 [Xylariomycetidae sp. FL2044]
MSVAVQYPATFAMNSSPTRPRQQHQSPRDYIDDAALYHTSPGRPNNQRFDSHDDFYDFLEKNRGPGPSTSSLHANSGMPLQSSSQPPPPPSSSSASHMPMRPAPNAAMNRAGPPEQQQQSRPPMATNSLPSQQQQQQQQQRRSRPPSYTEGRAEEMLAGRPQSSSDEDRKHLQRQTGGRRPHGPSINTKPPPTRSGSPPLRTSLADRSPTQYHPRRTDSSSDPSMAAPPPAAAASSSSSSQQQQQQAAAAAAAAASIQRLKSPSVLDCVLQPLDQKVQEYGALMTSEQEQMARLDDEIRALQGRRADAEARFLEAKGKHDDYRRQYADVERAMRGEAPAVPALPPMVAGGGGGAQRGLQRPVSFRDDDDDDDDLDDEDDEDLGHGRPGQQQGGGNNRRNYSEQSFGRQSQKMRTRDRFRISLFGGGGGGGDR